MLACREVARLIASDDIRGAGPFRRLEFRLHLMMCRHCRNYVRQVGLMGNVARRIWKIGAEDAEDVADLEGRVLKAVWASKETKPQSSVKPDPPRAEV